MGEFMFQAYTDYINESAAKYTGTQNQNSGGGGLLSGIGKLFG